VCKAWRIHGSRGVGYSFRVKSVLPPRSRRESCGETAADKNEGRGVLGFPVQLRGLESGRQDLNLRPLGPEPAPGEVLAVGRDGRPSQPLDNAGVDKTAAVEPLPRKPPSGGYGSASADQVAAELRRPERELLRPEDLLPVTAAAQFLGVCVATVHNAINRGKLRSHLFGSARRVRPEDLEAYAQARAAERPPADEDWRTVRDLMRAAEVCRSEAYRLIDRGAVPARVFRGVRYIKGDDLAAFTRTRRKGI
jgi:excisionase family DNA binding protein